MSDNPSGILRACLSCRFRSGEDGCPFPIEECNQPDLVQWQLDPCYAPTITQGIQPFEPSPYPGGMTRDRWVQEVAARLFVRLPGDLACEAYDDAEAFVAEGDRRRAEKGAP